MKTKLVIVGLAASAVMLPATSQAFDFKVSGQVNSAVLFGGDLDDTTVVDNSTSGSRFRIKGSKELDSGLKAGFRLEFQDQDNDSSNLTDRENTDVRYSDVWLSGSFGKFGLGKGDGAANGTFEAPCKIINGYACSEAHNLFGGKEEEGQFDGVALGYSDIDGVSRQNRIRYDSPKWSGFSFAVSIDNGDKNEFAAKYANKGDWGKLDARFGLVDDDDGDVTSYSIAYKAPFGLSLGYSFGENDGDNKEVNWIMVGYTVGKTTFSYGTGEEEKQDTGVTDDEMSMFGIKYKLTKGMDLYFNYIDFENDNGAESGDGMAFGSRIKF